MVQAYPEITVLEEEFDEEWLTREEAAAFIKLNRRTLENMAQRGEGPPYWRTSGTGSGRVLYLKSEIIAWAKATFVRVEPENLTRSPLL